MGAVLGQKTQLTTSGAVLVPAISPDGKQLAYLTKHCAAGLCTFSVDVQDVGGSTTRTILAGATAGYYLEWSPDRRNLAFNGTIDGRLGTYLLSALGGTPRFLSFGVATFYAGGDSLLLGPTIRPDSVFWIGVAGLDGIVHDSIRVAGPGQGLNAISVVPGTSWIVTLVLQQPHGLWQVIDRHGNVADHVVNACTCGGSATSDAVWLSRAGHGLGESIVRIAIDRTNGHLAARQDTMVTGLFTNFSLTADGAGMVMDEGTYDFSVWALSWPDVLRGRYPDNQRIAHASSNVSASISPNGARLLVRRVVPAGGGLTQLRYSVMPFAGGAEIPLGGAGVPVGARWTDSVTVALVTQTRSGLHLAQVDVRTNAQSNTLDLPDSTIVFATALPNGWAWIPAAGDRIVVRQAGHSRELPKPAWYAFLQQVTADRTGQRIFYTGYNKSTSDSLGVGVLALADGSMTQWASMFAEAGWVEPLADGTALLDVAQTQESLTFFKLSGPGEIQRLGASPRPVRSVSASGDLTRATASVRDYTADAWMYAVLRR